ncbi:F-box domain [Arabidopsis thaliana x Arabidopsis arenosa]|uniref:F-box domain n=1 Tax=Arabidopsis thaliana x Arabidopsis arenosa TaxID=1240361 RepID=A0A8T2BI52_9BRAS|nr:F-box domain [Arabidopsis thaliana x Arabidopsis arenosa]
MVRTSIKTNGSGLDRLSDLPEHLSCRILSQLSTKDSVRTSVLSKHWRNLWLHVPALDLDTIDFPNNLVFKEFIDRFVEFDKELDLKRFELFYDVNHAHSFDEFLWMIDDVVKRRVGRVTVINNVYVVDETLVTMPLSLYSCATLVNLDLSFVAMNKPQSELVSLPCVKTMHLDAVKFNGDDSILETLISSCSVLDDLTVIAHPGDYAQVVCVRSRSLKSFTLESQSQYQDPDVVIDCPRLEYMSVMEYQPASIVVHSIGPYAKVNIDVMFEVDYEDPLAITMIRSFLIAISKAREMTISTRTLELIDGYYLMGNELPKFSNLSRLNALLDKSFWDRLPGFLGCCINLNSFVLELDGPSEIEEIKVSTLLQDVLSARGFVQLKTPVSVTRTSSERKLAAYFVKKSG